MNIPETPAPEQLTPASLPLHRSLRNLYRSARHLQHRDPHAAARLARIADQAEYFLQQWPSASRPDWPMPAKAVLLAWLASVKREVAAGGTWSYTRWQQATTTLLAALVPFA